MAKKKASTSKPVGKKSDSPKQSDAVNQTKEKKSEQVSPAAKKESSPEKEKVAVVLPVFPAKIPEKKEDLYTVETYLSTIPHMHNADLAGKRAFLYAHGYDQWGKYRRSDLDKILQSY